MQTDSLLDQVQVRDAARAMLAALEECTGFLQGHQETPTRVARYQRHLDAIAAAKAAGIKAEG